MDNAFARMDIPHFFRYVLLNVALTVSVYALIVPFLIWQGNILAKTGGRKLDLLWLLVPVAGTVVATRAQWRYCAKDRYWDSAASLSAANVPVAA